MAVSASIVFGGAGAGEAQRGLTFEAFADFIQFLDLTDRIVADTNVLVARTCHQDAGLFEFGERQADSMPGGTRACDDIILHQALARMAATGNDLALKFAKHSFPVFRLFRYVLRTPTLLHIAENTSIFWRKQNYQ